VLIMLACDTCRRVYELEPAEFIVLLCCCVGPADAELRQLLLNKAKPIAYDI
jgi:hypothetical protein